MSRSTRRQFTARLPLLWAAAWASPSARGEDGAGFRVMVSRSLMGEVNENDLRASLKVWAASILPQAQMPVGWEREILAAPERLVQAVRDGQVDGVALTVPEYRGVAAYLNPATLLVDEQRAGKGEQYLIVVRDASGIGSLQELRGHSLVLHKAAATCLAPAWLQATLGAPSWGAVEAHFSAVTSETRVSKGVILPVFFQKVDACLLTRRSFDAACELNYQVGRQLRMMAASPPLVPILMAFHRDCPPKRQNGFLDAVLRLHTSPAGQQVLTLFQAGRLVVRDASVLRTTLELLAAADRIRAEARR
ncbi:MAG: PhnD/SsuA/transferrin family substrate-binding protein [Bryobacteraceae bacterium]